MYRQYKLLMCAHFKGEGYTVSLPRTCTFCGGDRKDKHMVHQVLYKPKEHYSSCQVTYSDTLKFVAHMKLIRRALSGYLIYDCYAKIIKLIFEMMEDEQAPCKRLMVQSDLQTTKFANLAAEYLFKNVRFD